MVEYPLVDPNREIAKGNQVMPQVSLQKSQELAIQAEKAFEEAFCEVGLESGKYGVNWRRSDLQQIWNKGIQFGIDAADKIKE